MTYSTVCIIIAIVAYLAVMLYLGFRYVLRAWRHFEAGDGTPFTSQVAGTQLPVWDEKAEK